LFALRTEGVDRPGDFVAQMAMGGKHRRVPDRRGLEQHPERVQRLVETSSPIASVSWPVAGHGEPPQIGGDRVGVLLDLLGDAGRPTGQVAIEVADMLQHLLRLSRPERSRELLLRTARWNEEHGEYVSALTMYERAHAVADAARVLMPGALAEAFVRRVPIDLRGVLRQPAPGEELPDATWTTARRSPRPIP
jgi:hypothetical protein